MNATRRAIAYHISDVIVRRKPPVIEPLHAEFYHGTRTTDESSGPFRIAKNVHVTPSVAIIDGALVMVPDLLSAIRAVAKCNSKGPVIVEHTYRYPFAPGDTSYLQDSAYTLNLKSYQRIAMRFCRKYACKEARAFELVVIDVPLSQEGTADRVQCRVPALPDEGGDKWDFDLSPKDVQVHGIVRTLGFAVSPQVWRIIGRHLKFPYFIVHRLDHEGHAVRVPLE